MPRIADLKSANSLQDVAALLSFAPSALSYILYKRAANTNYITFQIPKRNGGQRTINAPYDPLKRLQRNLADLLQDCVNDIQRSTKRQDFASHGFKRDRSIITNAQRHRNRRWVLNMDLADFFPSINFGRIRGYLISNRDFALSQQVATIVAQIACHNGTLPQGSPCSPVISNLIAQILDVRLIGIAKSLGCTYSRYADDLTFSTNKREFPADIAERLGAAPGEPHTWQLSQSLRDTITHSGFSVNDKKTRMMYRDSRQAVTGLIVNNIVNVRQEYRHNVRAMVNQLVTTGQFELLSAVPIVGGSPLIVKRPGTFDELQGMLGFISSVAAKTKRLTQNSSKKKTSFEASYRQFLIYRNFYACDRPVVICEGDTDNVYLTHAIINLAAKFPALAEVQANGKVRLKIRLFKYANSGNADLLNLRGGSGDLKNFILNYKKEIENFKGGLQYPLIVLFDNDSGADSIWSIIRNISKQKVTTNEAYIRITKNLVAVPTPGKPSTIEDFFPEKIKQHVFEGKVFHDGPGFDKSKHIGKQIFAHRVIRENAKDIDFSGFSELLSNLEQAVESHNYVEVLDAI